MTITVQERLMQGRAFAQGYQHPMLDPTFGGQLGFAPDLRYWVNNANYVQRNLIPILVEAPRFFQYLQNPDKWRDALRAMVELHPRTIEGLNSTLTVEVDSTPVGGAGEIQQEFVNVTRARSEPVFTWDEKYGRPFGTMLENWITQGMMDPATKVANIGTLAGQRPNDMLPDQYAMTMLFIEPDPMHRHVLKAWLITNMFPQGTGDITGRRDITSPLPLQQINVTFSALTQVGAGVNAVAQSVLDGINITNANPNLRAAFIQEIAPDVMSTRNGYGVQTQEMGDTAINLG